MKILKNIAFYLLVIISLICCQDDDENKVIIPGSPTGTEVRYTVETSTPMLIGIDYRGPGGEIQQGYPVPESPNSWFRTIIVLPPFQAKLDAKLANNSFQEQTYTLKVFIDGVLKKTETGTVPIATNGVDADNNPIVIPGSKTGTIIYQLE